MKLQLSEWYLFITSGLQRIAIAMFDKVSDCFWSSWLRSTQWELFSIQEIQNGIILIQLRGLDSGPGPRSPDPSPGQGPNDSKGHKGKHKLKLDAK